MSQQHHNAWREMTALAPTANAGKEYVCGEVAAYTAVYNPESSHFAFFLSL